MNIFLLTTGEKWVATSVLIGISLALILFQKRMNNFIGKKLSSYVRNKIGEAEYDRFMQERIVFKRSENYFRETGSHKSRTYGEPALYKTKISHGYMALFVAMIVFGLLASYFSPYLSRNAIGLAERCFPLIFTLYGAIMVFKYFATKYVISKEVLSIQSGTKRHEIQYGSIMEIGKRTINQGFRHGHIKGRIRAETDSKVLFITFIDANKQQRVIMISPKSQEEFIQHILLRIKEA